MTSDNASLRRRPNRFICSKSRSTVHIQVTGSTCRPNYRRAVIAMLSTVKWMCLLLSFITGWFGTNSHGNNISKVKSWHATFTSASNVGPYGLFCVAACPCTLFIAIISLFINWANKDASLLLRLLVTRIN